MPKQPNLISQPGVRNFAIDYSETKQIIQQLNCLAIKRDRVPLGSYSTVAGSVSPISGVAEQTFKPLLGNADNGVSEISLLNRLRGVPNIIQLMSVKVVLNVICMTFEAMQDTLSSMIISKPFGLGGGLIFSIMNQLIAGVVAIHESGILHSNIDPKNILIDQQGKVKMSGFCFARYEAALEASFPRHAGDYAMLPSFPNRQLKNINAGYVPPEFSDPEGCHNETADVYSVAIILFEMLTGANFGDLCCTPGNVEAIVTIHERVGKFSMTDFLPSVLLCKRNQRPTAAQFQKEFQQIASQQGLASP